MSHIHLPDGLLPVWLWVSGYALVAVLTGIAWQGGSARVPPRRFALLGIFAALMILVAMIEIPPLAYHFNLSVVAGIILGPRLAILAALMVNLFLALIGHGGVTVIGLNTLTLYTEMLVGYGLFHLLRRAHLRVSTAGIPTTICALLAGTAVSFGIIAAGSPWISRLLQSATLAPGEELPPGVHGAHLNLQLLALIMFGAGAIGWVMEALLTSAILSYLDRVYPGLLGQEE